MVLKMREVDVTNTEKLAQMENITVINSPDAIYDILGISKD
jgi:flavoprotein